MPWAPDDTATARLDLVPSRTVTKPLLVAISLAVEEFALATPDDPPIAVVTLFQHGQYFAQAAQRYARIGHRTPTLVAFAGAPVAALPTGVDHVALGDDDPLLREWSVTVLGRRTGATLVAWDLEHVDGAARSLENGRTFTARWSFRREAALSELRRLRGALPAGADPDGVLDRALAAPHPGPDRGGGLPHDTAHDAAPHDAAMTLVVGRLAAQLRSTDRALADLDDVVPGAERDPQSGLPTRAFLDRWTWGSAPGTLPVGLILLRVHELTHVRRRHGADTEREVLTAVARVLARRAGDADRVVRVGREEFLLVLPSHDGDHLARWAERIRAEIGALSGGHPFVPTPASAVITRTRRRPLPLPELWAALDRAVDTGAPVTVLAT